MKLHATFIGAKQKYLGMCKTQKSGIKTSSEEIGLNMRTHASPKVGQDHKEMCKNMKKTRPERTADWMTDRQMTEKVKLPYDTPVED